MNRLIAVIVIVVVAGLVASASTFRVYEGEQVIVTEFGKPKRTILEPGIAFRTPFIQEVHRLEKRLLPWDGAPENMPTKDKKRIFIDVWARWRIVDPMKFYTAVRTELEGRRKLNDLVNASVRDVIAGYNLIECVRSSNAPLLYDTEEFKEDRERHADHVTVGRQKLEEDMLTKVNAGASLAETYGMEVTTIRIKRVNYIDNVRERVYERMISERTRIAKLFESEAEEERNRIFGSTRKELDQIEGVREQRSAEIKGEADAAVIKIYAEALSEDPEFYKFLRSLEAFKKTLGSETRLILSTDNELLTLLRGSAPTND